MIDRKWFSDEEWGKNATLGVLSVPWVNWVVWSSNWSSLMIIFDDNILMKLIVEKEHHVLPILSAISAARSPQIPLTAVRTLSPASTALKMAHSIAVWPVPLTAKVIMFRVWNMYWIPLLMSLIICHSKLTNFNNFSCTSFNCSKLICCFRICLLDGYIALYL